MDCGSASPPAFAHGLCVLGEFATLEYKCTDIYDPQGEITVLWNDPKLGIPWPVKEPILSEKDKRGERLEALVERLPGAGG